MSGCILSYVNTLENQLPVSEHALKSALHFYERACLGPCHVGG